MLNTVDAQEGKVNLRASAAELNVIVTRGAQSSRATVIKLILDRACILSHPCTEQS